MKTEGKYLCLPCFVSAEKVVFLALVLMLDVLISLSCVVDYMQYSLKLGPSKSFIDMLSFIIKLWLNSPEEKICVNLIFGRMLS